MLQSVAKHNTSMLVPLNPLLLSEKSEKESSTPWPLEWQTGTFMMSPRLFPEMDGLSWNSDWLIHRLTECAAAIPLLSCSFPPDGALGQTCWRRGWLMRGATADTACGCVCACTQIVCSHLVGGLDCIIKTWVTHRTDSQWDGWTSSDK